MADIIERIIFDDSKALPALNNITNAIKETDKAMESLNQETKKVSESIGKDVIKTNEEIAESTKKTAEAEKKALKEKVTATEIYGTSLDKIKAKLVEYRTNLSNTLKVMASYVSLSKTQEEGVGRLVNVFGGGGKAIRGLAVGFNVLKVAIAATGIGALIIGLTSLIAFFTRTQKGADFLARTFAGFKTAISVLGDAFANVGEKIFDAFQNPKQAVIDLWEVIKDNLINRLKAVPLLFQAIGNSLEALWNRDLKGLKSAAVDAGQALIQMGTGLDSEQQNKFADAVKDTAKQMSDAAREAANLEAMKQKLADAQIRLTTEEAKMRAVIAENKKEAEDTNNTYAKRIEAATKAIGTEQSLLQQKIKLAQDNVDIIRAEQNLTTNMRKDYAALAQAEAEVSNLKAESLEKQIELNNKINGLFKEVSDKLKQTKDTLFEIAKAYNLITDEEGFEIVKKKQIDELNNLKNTFKETIDLIKSTTSDKDKDLLKKNLGVEDLNLEIKKLEKNIGTLDIAIEGLEEREFIPKEALQPLERLPNVIGLGTEAIKKQIEEIRNYGNSLNIDVSGTINRLEKELKKSLSKPLKADPTIDLSRLVIKPPVIQDKDKFNLTDYLGDIETAEDLFDKVLLDIFGFQGSERAKEFLEGAGAFVSEWGNLLNESTEIQLSNIDKQLNKLTERRSKLESDLEEEQELFNEGLANNLGAKQAEVDGLIAEEARLNAEKEKLQRDAQRRQIIADSATQAQALITSSIQIIKGFAPLGPFGLPLGIAAVAALFGFFAKTKVDALKATKLHGGADRIDDYFGVPIRYGRSDIGNQKGYRLIDEDNGNPTNVIISAREMLLPEKVVNAQRVFFDNLKAGLYDGYDLSKLISSTTINKGIGVTNINHSHINLPKERKISRQYVPFVGKDGVQRAVLKTITEDMKDGSIIEFGY
jgi:hypothetical protein